MNASWNELLSAVLRPARPRLARCRLIAGEHARAERRVADERARALADCTQRIEAARASIFAAGDGVVTRRMTELEREWRTLSRAEPDHDRSARALWAKVAPPGWADRPRWTGADASAGLESIVALASDPDGIERAEACASRLRSALAPWSDSIGTAITWRITGELRLGARVERCFERPRRAASSALDALHGAGARLERAERLRRDVRSAARDERLPDAMGDEIAEAALVDFLWNACVAEGLSVPEGHPNAKRAFERFERPIAPLLDLWRTGYVLSSIDAGGVTLGAMPAPPHGAEPLAPTRA
jgi:hypothetical protein